MVKRIEVPLLIVGGGGTGLSIANFLANANVDYLLIERHKSTSIQPKAHYFNQRSMENYRQHGLAEAIYRAAAPSENMGKILWCTSLGGDGPIDRKLFIELDVMGGGGLRKIYEKHGSAAPAHIPQLSLEPILYRAAKARGPERIQFEHELISFEQDARGVLARVRDLGRGEDYEVRARYMVAADAGKTVGPALGITMHGIANLADFVSVHFSADLSAYIDRDDAAMRMIVRPGADGTSLVQGGLITMGPDRWDRHCKEWTASWAQLPGHGPATDDSDMAARVKAFLKVDVPIEVHRVSHWELGALLADRLRVGSVFITGDAAHKTTPIGGLGLNSGIQDAHNLAWKLALVLQGKADAKLLDSYEIERRPVVTRNVDWSMSGAISHRIVTASFGVMPVSPPGFNEVQIKQLLADTRGGEARRARMREVFAVMRPEYGGQDLEIGFCYEQGALVDDGSPLPSYDPMGAIYTPTTRPGCRLPHAWLQQGGRTVSTHDLVPVDGFLLIAGEDGQAWCAAANRVATETGLVIRALRVGEKDGDALDASGQWTAEREIARGGVVLVRPDGHVGYRSLTAVSDPAAALRSALNDILATTAE